MVSIHCQGVVVVVLLPFLMCRKKQPKVSGLQVFFGCFCMGHSEGKFPPKKKGQQIFAKIPKKEVIEFLQVEFAKTTNFTNSTCQRPMSPTSCFCVKNAAREDFTKQPKMVILKVEQSAVSVGC